MRFRSDEYLRAGAERIHQARLFQKAGRCCALSMYCSGLAVECVLRAFRWREDPTFEGRHDLLDLLKASRLLAIDEEHGRNQGMTEEEILHQAVVFREAMNEVASLWHNNLRFASEASLRAFLNRLDRLRGIRGDPLKKNASDLLTAAQTVVDRGVALWNSRKK